MNILILMIPVSLLLGSVFLLAFIWSASSGQFDDVQTPALRILDDGKENS